MKAVALKTVYFEHVRTKAKLKAQARGNGFHGVFSGLSQKDFDTLEALGAVRKATVGEIAEAALKDDDLEDGVETLVAAPVKPARVGRPPKGETSPQAGTDTQTGDSGADSATGEAGAESTDVGPGDTDLVG